MPQLPTGKEISPAAEYLQKKINACIYFVLFNKGKGDRKKR
jgi:hypothetical protein